MAGNNFLRGLHQINLSNLDFVSDELTIIGVDDTFVFDEEDEFIADISGTELSGTGYERKELEGKSITINTATTPSRLEFKGDNFTYFGINAGTLAGVVIAFVETNDADSTLLTFVDLPTIETIGTDLPVTFPNGNVMLLENEIE